MVVAIVAFFITLPLANTLTLDLGFPLTIAHFFAALIGVLLLWRDRLHPHVVTWLPASLFAAFCVIYTLSFVLNLGTEVRDYPWATGRFEPGIRSATKVLWLLGNVVIAVIIANAVRRTDSEGHAIRALAIGAVLAAVYGLYQVIGETHGFFIPFLPGTEFVTGTPSYWIVLRAKSTFLEPSFFGAFLAATLPFVVVGWRASVRKSGAAATSILLVSLAMAGIMVSFAIGGWFPAAVGVGVLVILSGRALFKPLLRRLVTGAVIATFLVFVTIPDLPRAVSALVYKGAIGSGVVSMTEAPGVDDLPPEVAELSAAERSATASAALSMFASSPVLGIGPGNFGLRYAEFKPAGVAEPTQFLIVNNIYAELLAESGILGFLTFVGAFVALGVLTVRTYRREVAGRRLDLGAGIAALAAVATSFLLSPTFTLLYQWAILGLVAALIARGRISDKASVPAQRDPRNF